MSATCGNCRWWDRRDDDTGICCRYAPRPVWTEQGIDEHWPSWPQTLEDERCGEHAPQPKETRDEA